MKWALTITGTARATPKTGGIGVFGYLPCIMAIIRKAIAVSPEVAKASTTERGYAPAALHLNEQYCPLFPLHRSFTSGFPHQLHLGVGLFQSPSSG